MTHIAIELSRYLIGCYAYGIKIEPIYESNASITSAVHEILNPIQYLIKLVFLGSIIHPHHMQPGYILAKTHNSVPLPFLKTSNLESA